MRKRPRRSPAESAGSGGASGGASATARKSSSSSSSSGTPRWISLVAVGRDPVLLREPSQLHLDALEPLADGGLLGANDIGNVAPVEGPIDAKYEQRPFVFVELFTQAADGVL